MKLNFQNIFLGVLVVAIVAAIIVFSNTSGGKDGDGKNAVKITMWGDISDNTEFRTAISKFNQKYQKKYNITYTYIKPAEFETKLIESIADNKSPDSILISNSKILRLETKLSPISYETLPVSKYNEAYIDSSKIFLSKKGALGFPLVLDPIVMYWNRDMFTNASIIEGPKYWDEIIPLSTKLTKRGDVTGTFDTSAIALGEFENINHGKDIISTLFLQSGISIVERNESGSPKASLSSLSRTTGEPLADSSLRFYMDFSNPLKTIYSWNRTQPNSLDAFLSEKLAMYIGRASDYKTIIEKNPHLRFDVGQIPQMKNTSVESTYAEVFGVSILKASKQQQNTLSALAALASDSEYILALSKALQMPPVRKDLLAKQQTDLIMPVFYNSAIRSKSWLDPIEEKSNESFSLMINGLSSGRFLTPSLAVNFLESEIIRIIDTIPK